MTFSILAVLCITLYTLRYILLWWKCLRRGGETPVRPKISPRDLQKVLPIATLMIVERALYRYASQFALGLELTVLKVISRFWMRLSKATLPFMYLIYNFGTTESHSSFTFLGLLSGLVALFGSSVVSPLAMTASFVLNFLLISITIRLHSALSDISLVALLLQLSIVYPHFHQTNLDTCPCFLDNGTYNEGRILATFPLGSGYAALHVWKRNSGSDPSYPRMYTYSRQHARIQYPRFRARRDCNRLTRKSDAEPINSEFRNNWTYRYRFTVLCIFGPHTLFLPKTIIKRPQDLCPSYYRRIRTSSHHLWSLLLHSRSPTYSQFHESCIPVIRRIHQHGK